MAMASITTTAAKARARGSRAAARAAIALGALGLSAVALLMGAANGLGRGDPAAGAALAPWDARMATAAAQALVDKGGKAETPRVRALVGAALARDATLAPALELRALQARADGDRRREARLFELSSAISRRSLPTRTWLIQRAVDHGDVAGALEDFDIALRTSANAPQLLFPALARATEDPALAAPIARVLDRPEDWRVMFLNYAITDGQAAPGVANVVMNMRDRRVITQNQIDQKLVAELVAEEAFADARRVHEVLHPAAARRGLVADPDFADPGMAFPFGWSLTERGDAGAVRAVADGRPVLAYRSLPGGSGVAATQLLTLPAGDYRLSLKTAIDASDREARPFWTLTCAQSGGGQIALVDQPAQAGGQAGADVAVPADCPAQWLALHLRESDSPDQQGAIASVMVAKR